MKFLTESKTRKAYFHAISLQRFWLDFFISSYRYIPNMFVASLIYRRRLCRILSGTRFCCILSGTFYPETYFFSSCLFALLFNLTLPSVTSLVVGSRVILQFILRTSSNKIAMLVKPTLAMMKTPLPNKHLANSEKQSSL